jgi:hypothetical protein
LLLLLLPLLLQLFEGVDTALRLLLLLLLAAVVLERLAGLATK